MSRGFLEVFCGLGGAYRGAKNLNVQWPDVLAMPLLMPQIGMFDL